METKKVIVRDKILWQKAQKEIKAGKYNRIRNEEELKNYLYKQRKGVHRK